MKLARTKLDVGQRRTIKDMLYAKVPVSRIAVFDPYQQRVTHAAITENKHLSAVLAHIKKEQEKATPPPKVKPVSTKNGYKKTGRRPPGRPSKMEAYYERRRAEWAPETAAASES